MAEQRSFIENDHVVEALAANCADDPLYVGSLPGRARRREDFFDPYRFHILAKLTTEDAVAVPQEVPRNQTMANS